SRRPGAWRECAERRPAKWRPAPGDGTVMTRQLSFILRRLLLTVPTLFLIIRLVPGDPVRSMLGFRATDANVAELRHRLGFDLPLLTQYLDWLGALLHGDLGQDIVSHAPL